MIELSSINYVWPMTFALFSAFLWALVPIIYKKLGDDVAPIGINLGKGLIACIFFGALFLFSDHEPINNQTLILLGISGILGISLGDTFYFESLMRLGPRLSLIITMLIPVVTMLLAITMLHETFSLLSWIGIFLTLSGVFLVLWDGSPAERQHNWKSGIIYGVLTVVCCASGIIFTKMVLVSTSALKATFIRQLSGTAGLLCWGLVGFEAKAWLKPFYNDVTLFKRLIVASFFGTFLGTWLCVLALKHADAGIATILNSTSPIFILPLSFFILKEEITFRAVVGSFVAVAGAGFIFLGR